MPPTPPLTRLLHIHLKPRIPYNTSLLLQEEILKLHWQHRAALKLSTTAPTSTKPSPPPPFLLSFSTHPTYTVGRRHLLASPLSPEQIAFLTSAGSPQRTTPPSSPHQLPTAAIFHPSPRGGLLTYHGPGQLTAYPILDLRRFGLSARCYVRLLENAVSRTCNELLSAKNSGIGRTTGRSVDDPGVWILEDKPQQEQQKTRAHTETGVQEQQSDACPGALDPQSATPSNRKICALGVQVTRGVTAHGIGLNVVDEAIEPEMRKHFRFDDALPQHTTQPTIATDLDHTPHRIQPNNDTPNLEGGYLTYGFSRITACGLLGKTTTWLGREGAATTNLQIDDVASLLAGNIVRGINEMRGEGKEEVDSAVHTVELSEMGEVDAFSAGKWKIEDILKLEKG